MRLKIKQQLQLQMCFCRELFVGMVELVGYIQIGGKHFLSKLFKEVTERVHCQQSFTTGHIMATCNARVERCHKTLENVIACYITADHTTWPQLLPVVLLAVRSTVSGRTGFAPYHLLFVSDPPRMGLPLLEVYHNRKSCSSPVCMQVLLMQTTQGVVTHCLPQ